MSLQGTAEIQGGFDKICTIPCVVKGYHECRFQVKVGDTFYATKKNGSKGRAFKVCDSRGQLGHLQRELVNILWPLNAELKW